MERGGVRAAAFWAAVDVRHRWRSLILLGVLVGVTGGLALSALAGARRTDSALPRLLAQTHASDAVVFPSQVNVLNPDWARLAARPEVAKVAVWDLLFGDINGQQGDVVFGSDDGTYLGAVDKPIVEKGRMFNPRAPDEVVVDENAAKDAPLGSTFRFQPYATGQDDLTGPPHGPTVTMHVVGVVREAPEFLFVSDGQVLVSPGFVEHYRSKIEVLPNADVALRHGAADIAGLRRDVNTFIAPGTPVLDPHATSRRLNTTLSVERTGLLILAASVALGGGILVALVLGRSVALVGDDALTLSAMGMTRRDRGVAAALSHLLSAAVAGVITFAVAFGASARFPVGLGRRIDPSVGYHVDWTVVGPGVALVALVIVGAAFALGWRARLAGARAALPRTSELFGALRRRVPVSVGLGASMAFEVGRGRVRTPVLPALVGPLIAVLGIVATLTINEGIADALAHPERAGVTWEVNILPVPGAQTGRNVTAELVAKVRRAVPSGSQMIVVDRDVLDVSGVGVPTFAIRPVPGARTAPVSFTVTAGRAPRSADEADIGPATANDLHVRIGDTVRLAQSPGAIRVVGEALFPSDVHAEFDEGLWVTPARYAMAVPPMPPAGSETDGRLLAVHLPAGADTQAAVASVGRGLGQLAEDIEPPQIPDELRNLSNVRLLPDVLAGFLGVVAVAAVTYVLVSSARRRRGEFAVMRAMGMTRRSARSIVHAQSTVMGLFALVVGIPLGLVIGRSGWHVITEHVPLSDVAPLALVAVVLIVPATLIVTNAVALWPGRRVSRLAVAAESLRAE